MTTNANPDIVNEAKAYAREAIREAIDDAAEFDAICTDDEARPISSVSITRDPAKTYSSRTFS